MSDFERQYEFTRSLYDMELHDKFSNKDTLSITPLEILRVPGGWIYYMYSRDNMRVSTFVPFSNEFQPGSRNDLKHPIERLKE